MDIKEIKNRGKEAFKANYWRCVLVAFLLSLLSTGTTASVRNNVQDGSGAQAKEEVASAIQSLSPGGQMAFAGVVFGSVTVILLVSVLLRVFVFNPLQVGGYRFFRRNARETGVDVGVVKEGFGEYGRTFITLFLRDLYLFLWTLLLIIPGIIKAYSYMLVPYLLKDNPELSATEAIARSKELMDGHKWEAFVLDLSFIGWYLLGAITAGLVNLFWTHPYHESARARFYLNLIGG